MKQELGEFIIKHAVRGACTCEHCSNAQGNPEEKQPTGHTADVEFFKVSTQNNPHPDALRSLIKENKGEFIDVDLFDGKEHGFIEIGGWIGDQNMGLMLMGLGEILGLWKLFTPTSLNAPEDLRMMMAQNGLVSIMSD